MNLTGSLGRNARTVPLAFVAAVIAAVALLALSPPAARGQTVDGPATMQECREELSAGRAVLCARNSFAVKTTLADGSYHINWSKWADRYSNIDRYSVQRLRFMYRYNFQLEADGAAVNDWEYTAPDVASCRPQAAETDNMGRALRWFWSCGGISNVHEDPSGAATSIELLDDSWTSSSWAGSLEAPGRKHNVAVQAFRIPGSQTEAHADNPQSATDRLTQQQVDDGTVDLLASDVEMHLVLITVHFDDGRTRRSYELITGSPFDDRQ